MRKIHWFLTNRPWLWCMALLAIMVLFSLGGKLAIPELAPVWDSKVPFEVTILGAAILYQVFRNQAFSSYLILGHFYFTFFSVLLLVTYISVGFSGVAVTSAEPLKIGKVDSNIIAIGITGFFFGQVLFGFNLLRSMFIRRNDGNEGMPFAPERE